MISPLVVFWLLTGAISCPARDTPGPPAAISGLAPPAFGELVVDAALGFVGRPYRFGGENPRTGVDCAGLVRLVFSSVGVDLPRTAGGQIRLGREIPRLEIEAGDLIFFRDTSRRGISHVGIAIGNNRFVHAASCKRGVCISSLASRYYREHYESARRLLESPSDEGYGSDSCQSR